MIDGIRDFTTDASPAFVNNKMSLGGKLGIKEVMVNGRCPIHIPV
jgi:hypothetical protein